MSMQMDKMIFLDPNKVSKKGFLKAQQGIY